MISWSLWRHCNAKNDNGLISGNSHHKLLLVGVSPHVDENSSSALPNIRLDFTNTLSSFIILKAYKYTKYTKSVITKYLSFATTRNSNFIPVYFSMSNRTDIMPFSKSQGLLDKSLWHSVSCSVLTQPVTQQVLQNPPPTTPSPTPTHSAMQ